MENDESEGGRVLGVRENRYEEGENHLLKKGGGKDGHRKGEDV